MKRSFFLLVAVFMLDSLITSCNAGAEAKLSLFKEDGKVYVRSHFSEKEDLVVAVGLGRGNKQINFNGTFLIDKDVPLSSGMMKKARLIHGTGDDVPSCHINGTYIGANHGVSSGLQVKCEGHGLTVQNLGSEWEDDKGRKFYLIRVIDENQLLFLGENSSTGPVWSFQMASRDCSVLKSVPLNKSISFSEKTRAVQVYPACRIRKQEYLVDGRNKLIEGEPVYCNWFDIVEEYDIINPGSVLADIISHPGVERSFNAEQLDGVIRYNLLYRFYPNGSNTIYHRMKALQDFRMGQMLYICSVRLYNGGTGTLESYVPKTLPFTQDNINYDFRNVQDYSFRLPSPLDFNVKKGNLENPDNPPDRFIQFLGRKEGEKNVREAGFAMGYSMIHGMGIPSERIKNTNNFLNLYISNKTYPFVANGGMLKMITAGTEFYCVCYRQYFDPAQTGNATSFYWNRQEDDTVVYVDYHKKIDRDLVRLPAEMAGRKIGIIEKTPSLEFLSGDTVGEKGVEVSVNDTYGYVVFKLK